MQNIEIYTDGACSGNPGIGGWGAVILIDGKEERLSGAELLTTNNRMELSAALFALEKLQKKGIVKGTAMQLTSDSQYLKNGITTWIQSWKKNGWKTANKQPVKNKDLWEALDALNAFFSIEWKWVKGHAGHHYNEICDELARKAMDG